MTATSSEWCHGIRQVWMTSLTAVSRSHLIQLKTFSFIQFPVGTCASFGKDFYDFRQDLPLIPLFSNQAPYAMRNRQLLAALMNLIGLSRSSILSPIRREPQSHFSCQIPCPLTWECFVDLSSGKLLRLIFSYPKIARGGDHWFYHYLYF